MDRKIFFMVGASLALSYALQATGGAAFIATNFIEILGDSSKWVILMVLFFTMALFTNILSNNASAVLFTPIAINMAINLGADPKIFIIAVIFACNCSFITPIGYQTNLLVMGPGNYRFADFVKVGLPLTILMCLTYTLFAPWYFQ
jgi:di/tricarboxylate transporter